MPILKKSKQMIKNNMHSIYVDQWSWEKIIAKEERNYGLLQEIVKNIFEVFKITEETLINSFPEKELERTLPKDNYSFLVQN